MDKKLKIAVLLHGLGANGIDTLFANLSEQWSENLDIVYFIAVDEDNIQFWEDRVGKTGVRIIRLHDLDKGRLKQWPSTLSRALKEYGPFDAVHTNMDMLNGINMMIAWTLKIPVRVSHAHRGSSDKKAGIKEIASQLMRSAMRVLMRSFSTNKIGCSDVAGEYFFGKNNFELLVNGIKLPQLPPPPTAATSANKQFITVCRMATQKNPLRLVSIFDEIRKVIPGTTLTWCGDGPMRGEVEKEISRRGLQNAVSLMGNTDRVPELLAQSEYFLLPSLYEGLSLALAEAQAYRLDCFVSDTCSRMSDCGKCLFIPLDSPDEEWAKTISEYIKGSEKMQLDNARMKLFDIKTMARRLEKIYASKS